ncbi:MAG: VOC family protein [Fischerella sp. CENA71]|nr:VOC family protein [Fischerella sp. CENA71]
MSIEMNLTLNSVSALAKYAKGIDHIAIAVLNLEKSISWFTEVLGFTVIERRKTEGNETAMISAVLSAGPLTVVLLEGISANSQISKYIEHYGVGVQHIAIAVEDLSQVATELSKANMEFDTSIVESTGLKQIFSKRDKLTGMMFEFIERTGSNSLFSDQNVEQLFMQLEQKDLV